MTARSSLPGADRDEIRACLQSMDRGERTAAVASARSLARSPEPAVRFAATRLLYLLRLYQEALDSVRERLASHADDAYAHRLLYSLLKRLRFEEEADAALGDLLRVADDARVHEAAALHYQGMGRAPAALTHLERVLRAHPDARHYRTQLRLAIDAGDLDTARRAASQALRLEPTRWLDVVDDLLEIGSFDLAEREARLRLEEPEARAVLGQLALFRGAWSEAYEHAASAHQRQPDSERAMTVMVGASVMAGDLDRAERDLGGWKGESGPTLRTWIGELWMRRNDLEGAKRELNRVQNEIRDYMAAKLLWVIVKGKLDEERWVTTTAYDGLLEGQLQAFGIEPRIENGLLDADELRAAATEALAWMGGNRSPFATVWRNGELRAIQVPPSPRHRAASVQHLARYLGLERTKQDIVAELARIGPHPIAECYEAELYLWSGEYEPARAKFERILAGASQTTWAWIGLGASQVYLGDPAAGLRSLDEGVKMMGWRGATLPVYRGEALFRLGRLDDAAAELAEACKMQPGRVGAWVLRVLVEEARGQATERDAAFAHLDAIAPALLSDAARTAGVDGWWYGPPPSVETKLRVAEQALALLRGNRSSSCPIWIDPESGAVRSFLYQRPVTTPAWEAAERRSLFELAKKDGR